MSFVARKKRAGTAMVDWDSLSKERLEHMAAAGQQVLECYRVLRKTGGNMVGELLRNAGTFYEWDHYPKGDVYDGETFSQYYYHAHPADLRGGEHGHFHTFLRGNGMPDGVRPAPLPDFTPPENPNDALSHLIAISMNPAGFPIRLFSTNRWVTGEAWYVADDVIAMLDRFDIDHAQPSWPVNIWVTNMVRLFHPQIEVLVRQRDAAVAAWQDKKPDENAYEDRELEITSVMDIAVEDQIVRVERALGRDVA
jgi:hypothetical protein